MHYRGMFSIADGGGGRVSIPTRIFEVVSIAYPVLIDAPIVFLVRVSYSSRPSTEPAFHLHSYMRGGWTLIDLFHCFIHLAIMYNFFIC